MDFSLQGHIVSKVIYETGGSSSKLSDDPFASWRATSQQVKEMLKEYDGMIKIVVDIRRRFLSGGGEMHADCESVLLEDGSEQDDLWGANW
jgi:hypothetical protein